MTTNEERREVARKLREKQSERNRPDVFVPQSMGVMAEILYEDLISCVPNRGNIFLALADLIDPEPERTCTITYAVFNEGDPTGEYESWNCSHCGELPYDDADSFSYCPCCGTKVIQDVNE